MEIQLCACHAAATGAAVRGCSTSLAQAQTHWRAVRYSKEGQEERKLRHVQGEGVLVPS